uniref:Large ribosomal subunit protein mL42 n=1 Tax=Lygus hesperus TaxID=30085 RepID=A0A0A9XKY5_LYGHE
MLASKFTSSTISSVLTNVARKTTSVLPVRNISNVEDPIVLTKDGSTFVAWHPEKPVPYECTKPMPTVAPQPPQILRMNDCSEVMKKKKELEIVKELAAITYTTKHRWFPRGNRFKRMKKVTPNREYL